MNPFALALAVLFAVPALAETPTFMVETDPSTFALGGFAAHLRLQPKDFPVALGVGVYALDLPAFLVDLNPANRGWKSRIELGAAAFGDYYFSGQPRGLFAGVELAAMEYRYTDAQGGAARATNLLVMPRVGYLWRPFEKLGLYLLPWAGLGLTGQVLGSAAVDADSQYAVSPLVPFGALHVGWQL